MDTREKLWGDSLLWESEYEVGPHPKGMLLQRTVHHGIVTRDAASEARIAHSTAKPGSKSNNSNTPKEKHTVGHTPP